MQQAQANFFAFYFYTFVLLHRQQQHRKHFAQLWSDGLGVDIDIVLMYVLVLKYITACTANNNKVMCFSLYPVRG